MFIKNEIYNNIITMEQYNQYQNILIFAKKYRHLKVISKELSKEEFVKEINSHEYVKIECENTYIYLFNTKNNITSKSKNMAKILDAITRKGLDVILVIPNPLTSVKKIFVNYEHLNIYTYLGEIFGLELPIGPLCSIHEILTTEQTKKLLNETLQSKLTNLPKIYDDDPQIIWCGAKIGDVVKVKILSNISGEFPYYRVVVPRVATIAKEDGLVEPESFDIVEDEDLK